MQSNAAANAVQNLFRTPELKDKILFTLLCLLVLAGGLVATTAISGCGTAGGFFAQAQQSYDVTITATAGGVQHSAVVSLEVQ